MGQNTAESLRHSPIFRASDFLNLQIFLDTNLKGDSSTTISRTCLSIILCSLHTILCNNNHIM
eukprot:c43864_g1_i1 orf=2-187(-)